MAYINTAEPMNNEFPDYITYHNIVHERRHIVVQSFAEQCELSGRSVGHRIETH